MSDHDHDGEESFDECELNGNGRCRHVHPGMSHREYERENEAAEITRKSMLSAQAHRRTTRSKP